VRESGSLMSAVAVEDEPQQGVVVHEQTDTCMELPLTVRSEVLCNVTTATLSIVDWICLAYHPMLDTY
jgi:hypothetical protein